MVVHERIAALPTADMDVTENGSAPTGVYDPEWVVGLLDTMAKGDLDATAHALEQLARRLRKAARARNSLIRVPAASLRAAMALRSSQRKGVESCP
jgi:hypothetical protein